MGERVINPDGERIFPHAVPAPRASGAPTQGQHPTDLAGALEHLVSGALDEHQQVSITLSLRDALQLAKVLRRAELAGV